jgi:hypothetical protein
MMTFRMQQEEVMIIVMMNEKFSEAMNPIDHKEYRGWWAWCVYVVQLRSQMMIAMVVVNERTAEWSGEEPTNSTSTGTL